MAAEALGRQCRWLVMAVLSLRFITASTSAQSQAPPEILDQPWKVSSLLKDSGLAKKNLFNLDFIHDKSSPRYGTAWLATSDGLYEFDGYIWRRYSRADGLPSDFVRCVHVTQTGQLWVGTDRGAGTFDGKRFDTHGSEDGLAGPNVRRINQDPDGTLWFCSDSWPNGDAAGGITSWKNNQWHAYRKQDGLPSQYVVDHLRDSQGRHFAATLAGLAELRGDRWIEAFAAPAQVTFKWRGSSLAESPTYGLMYSAGHEVFLRRDAEWIQGPAGRYHHSGICSTADGHLIASAVVDGTRHAFFEWTTKGWEMRSASYVVPLGYHEDVQEAPDGSIWVVGYDCLVRWQRRGAEWQEFSGVSQPQFTDVHGGIWFGRQIEKQREVSPTRLLDGRWERSTEVYDQLIHSPGDRVWGLKSNKLVFWRNGLSTEEPIAPGALVRIDAGALDRQGALWLFGQVTGASNAVARYDGTAWMTRVLPELPGSVLPSRVCGGSNGIWVIAEGADESDAYRLAYIGERELEIRELSRPLVSRFRFSMHADRSGSLWLYGDAGMLRVYTAASNQAISTITNLPARHVFACLERGNELWFGYSGSMGGLGGVARLRDEVWTLYPIEALLNLSVADDGTLMAGGQGVLTLLAAGPDPTPVTMEVPGDMAIKGVVKAGDGSYWLGDEVRVLRFKPDRRPPLTGVQLSQTKLLRGDSLQVTAWATDPFQPRGSRQDHRFSWRLDSGSWSPFQAGRSWEISTKGLRLGTHEIQVRSQDAGMDLDPNPAMATLQIFPIPIQSRRWFLPALGISLLLVTLLATIAWRAKAQLAQHAQGLEAVVRERTAELQADLEQRKRMAEVVRGTEEKFSKAFQSSPAALAIRRVSDGRFIEVNAACEALTGYTALEMLGKTATDLQLCPDTPADAAATQPPTPTRGFKEKEIRLRTKSGQIRVVLESAEIITVSGNPCVLTTLMDITVRRQLEEQLRQVQKLEAIGTLAGGIAHDFNNILSAVVGYADLTRLEIGADHPAAENLEHIRKAGTRAKHLVQQLLSFSRPQPQSRRVVSLQSVIEESVSLLRATLPAGIELITSIHDASPPVLADVNQIHQVLLNLCTNAGHAIGSEQGRIEISLCGVELDAEQAAKLSGIRPGSFACLSVTDSGVGMDAALIPRIFEPFFTTKTTGQGTGLGLSVVHGIVKSHDGGILVTSRPGVGTTFQVFLPKAHGCPENVPPAQVMAPRGEGQHILYLDDEDVLVDLAKRILGRLGYSVTGFTDADEAIDAFRQAPDQFDVIVTDLNMPGHSGLKVAEEILKMRPNVPVILSSGHVTEDIQKQARRIGILQVLYKPNTMDELGASVHRLIEAMKVG